MRVPLRQGSMGPQQFVRDARLGLLTMALFIFGTVGVVGCDGPMQILGDTVFISDIEPGVVSVDSVFTVYGSGLDGVVNSSNDEGVDSRDTEPSVSGEAGSCSLPTDANAVLVGGVPAYVCYRTSTRIDVVVPDLSPGAHYLVVRSDGRTSEPQTVYVVR